MLCLRSIKQNSKYNHEILLHINDGSDGTLNFAKENNFNFSYSKNNIGLCSSINLIARKATKDLILYSHDDMYFCPNWDIYLLNEVKNINHNKFYLSGTMIEQQSGHIKFDCGSDVNNFTVPPITHFGYCRLAAQPSPANINGMHSIPFLNRNFIKFFSFNSSKNRSIVYQDIKFAKRFNCFCNP